MRAVIGVVVVWLVLVAHAAPAAAQDPAPQPPAPAAGPSRLFYGPTGRMLPPGQGYVAFDGLFLVTVQLGVTPRFSIGGGTSPLFWFVEDIRGPFWVTPKFRVYANERTSLAAGAVSMFVPGEEGSFGMAYLVGTTGTPERSVTIGGAFGYYTGDGEGGVSTPLLLAAGERRVRPRLSIVTENWIGWGGGFASVGLRRHGRRLQGDIGFGLGFGGDVVVPALIGNVAVKFGGPRMTTRAD